MSSEHVFLDVIKEIISRISRACYCHVHDMCRIRRFLTPSVAKTIATSLIGSKLDYCPFQRHWKGDI